MKGKKKANKTTLPPKPLRLPNDTPVHLDMSFEDAIKLALNTPLKNSKVHKK